MVAWWGAHFLVAELALAVAVTIGVAVWGQPFGGTARIDSVLSGTRSTLYGVLATLWGALIGFIIATVTIVLGFLQTPRLRVVRESVHYRDLWRTFNSAIRVLGLATAAAVAALITDKDAPAGHPDHVVFYVCFFASLLAALRLARCIWVLHHVVSIATGPSRARPPGE